MPGLRPSSATDRNLASLLAEVNRLARREFDRRVRHLDLTRAQWLFLFHLGRKPGATQSELAELLQMERISVSRQAGRLEKAGWIERRNHAADGRAYHLSLTRRAEKIFAKLETLAGELRADYLRGLPPPRRTALLDDLAHIKANLLRLQANGHHSLS
ncbi:MarR family transcriptional regulator [Opitutus sp. GAS368]|jgi:MarR family transcriptional regulator for hemolysin|uniref:MarR family winged helix-turn-helix transcriptional regulator n=1 Tax=Opitutus sp. GAS368 TaxID=1882749 RepID=UPI00087D2937|nr:MarR family transcriptional regulator [Opitutus sp. GAS368]SDS01807.1 DNA-binding transcriptional regulator, MarR family [Opitutus sp. GAS368]